MRTILAAWSIGVLVALVSAPAHAEITKGQCIAANTAAQSLRREGRLAEAREQLRTCVDPQCPGLVSADCVKRLDELESAQPTVIFAVKDASGHNVTDVQVAVDGRPWLDRLDGRAVAMDLGEHTLTFKAGSAAPVTKKIVLREGEKSRQVRVILEGGALEPSSERALEASSERALEASSERALEASSETTVAGPSPDGQAPSSDTPARSSSRKTLGFVVAGVGAAGLAAGGVFGLMTIAAKKRQVDNCSNTVECPDHGEASSAHEAAKQYGTISTIAVAAGAATTALGIVLVATAKPSRGAATTRPWTLSAAAWPGAGFMRLRGDF